MAIYTDLDLSFEPHPATSDVMRLYDVAAVKASLKNILLTVPGEKPFQPYYGVNINQYLFDIMDSGMSVAMKKNISEQIRIYEPRCVVEDIQIGLLEEDNAVIINIVFYVIGISNKQQFTYSLERNR